MVSTLSQLTFVGRGVERPIGSPGLHVWSPSMSSQPRKRFQPETMWSCAVAVETRLMPCEVKGNARPPTEYVAVKPMPEAMASAPMLPGFSQSVPEE